MRRMHWWGAAAGVGALAVAAVGIPSALAAPGHGKPGTNVRSAVVKPAHGAVPANRTVSAKHGNGHDGNGHDGNGHHGGHGNPHCDYPPHGRPDVSVGSDRSKVHRNSEVTFTGTVKINGCGYENQKAGLYKRVQGPHHREWWEPVGGPATTDKQGVVSFKVTVVSTSDYRVFTAPDAGLAPGASSPVTVQVKDWHDRGNNRGH